MRTKIKPGQSVVRELGYLTAAGDFMMGEFFDRYCELWPKGSREPRHTMTYEEIFRKGRPVTWRKGKA